MLIFDIETDGLLDTVTKIHCMVIYDDYKDEYTLYRPKDIEKGVKRLVNYTGQIVGHNIIAFDIPVMEKLYNVTFNHERAVDTLVLARLVFSNIKDIDAAAMRKGIQLGKMYGSHSLKAYGYRLGVLKGTYAEDNEECWSVFNEDMLEYNKQDVVVTKALYEKLKSKGFTQHASIIEHKAQWLMQKQEHNGICFDIAKAYDLKNLLDEEYAKTVEELKKYAPKIPDKVFIPKRDNQAKGYKAGVPIQRYKEFNPSSRQQLEYILSTHYNYQFKDNMYTPTRDSSGKITSRKLTLDEETLKHIQADDTAPDEVKHLASLYQRSFLLSKRLGQLAEGQNAWLKMLGEDLRIHGRVNPNGAVSGRATHNAPNLAQVPNASSPYGKECRELFTVPEGWYQAGIDCSGLELRCLAHYLYKYDHGAYAHEILNGDIHTANQHAAGLPTRNDAKRFIYGFLYGAGNAKIGEIVNGTEEDGKRLKEKFLKNTPALKSLQKAIKDALVTYEGREQVWKRKYLIGLDGRKLYVRSPHSALNLLLQSAGALICKRWITRIEERLLAQGMKHDWEGDFVFMAWVHDEIQIACKDKVIADTVVIEAQNAIRDVQLEFKFNVQLETEGKVGKNWYETH